jgi:putative ABC transport system permease protein
VNVFKIAWRSVQYRGFGSLLTILSMALGVMLVVGVLTIHGVVSKSFKSNSSFGYNIILGARGGALQLTLNTVYYLSKPIETIPYEYYLTYCDEDTRRREFANSVTLKAHECEQQALDLAAQLDVGGPLALLSNSAREMVAENQIKVMETERGGLYEPYAEMAIPICLGDYYEVPNTNTAFRVCGTKPTFFSELVLDLDTREKFRFADGNNFNEFDEKYGYFSAVIGATVARQSGLKVGDSVYPTHGVPGDSSAHIHEQGFVVVGVLEPTGTAHDRIVFINLEGFFLMEDHAKPIQEDKKKVEAENEGKSESKVAETAGMFDEDQDAELEDFVVERKEPDKQEPEDSALEDAVADDEPATGATIVRGVDVSRPAVIDLTKEPLPIEQRELTAILIRTASSSDDEFSQLTNDMYLTNKINGGALESNLEWTQFRPRDSQKAAQAVNPIQQIEYLFSSIVDPIRWLLLILTLMICVVSGISILVGIYNSMSQRKSEIAVMRALGANRGKVMIIILLESVLLALAGGLLGWIGGHALNVVASPYFEAQTGVPISFFSFAPAVPLGTMLGGNLGLPEGLANLKMSPEFLIIPGLIVLAIFVGLYPAVSAYRTDVSKSLGK